MRWHSVDIFDEQVNDLTANTTPTKVQVLVMLRRNFILFFYFKAILL